MNGIEVIVVEDSLDDIMFMGRVLKKYKPEISVKFISEPEEALKVFSSEEMNLTPPKLVLLDIKMPKVSGFDILKLVKKSKALEKTPVVMLTSSDQLSDRQKAYEMGVNSFLEKPKNYQELKVTLPTIIHYWLDLNK